MPETAVARRPRKRDSIFPLIAIATGIILMLYPWISNWLYDRATDSEVTSYEAIVEEYDGDEVEAAFAEAREYNEHVLAARVTITDPFIESADEEIVDNYDELLDLDGSGIMCFVEIPKINVYLPVYHGASTEVLEKGAGHIQGTALPTGDTGIRPVISAHTGINKAKMFSDLTELEEGDLFFLHVLGETFAYEVCDIEVILPEDVSALSAEEGRDLVTLMTCTPYGVNTHRLIVTGERTDYTDGMEDEIEKMDGGSQWKAAYRRALIIGALISVVLITLWRLVLFMKRRKRKN